MRRNCAMPSCYRILSGTRALKGVFNGKIANGRRFIGFFLRWGFINGFSATFRCDRVINLGICRLQACKTEKNGKNRGKEGKFSKYLVKTASGVIELVQWKAMESNLQAAAAQLIEFELWR